MKTEQFIKALAAHPEKEVVFEYSPGRTVGAHYHITEVKNVAVDAVDCGGRADSWEETVIQLWENPSEAGKTNYMTAAKALAIINRVDRIKPITTTAQLRFEYGNHTFHTAQLPVTKIAAEGGYLVVQLHSQPASCKASETCGVDTKVVETAEACCASEGCCT